MTHKVFDIHSHVVPGVDDGSLNLNMSVQMIKKAYDQGVHSIICTSHGSCNVENYMRNFAKLKKKIKEENIGMSLYCGCEIYCDGYFIDNIIDRLRCGNILTINDTNYILVEFNPYEDPSIILKCIQRIVSEGYSPILAHVERYLNLSMVPKYIALLQECGCLFQVNAYSFIDESDKLIKSFARKLLDENRVSFIGSDAHRTNHRPYMINNGIDYIYTNCGVEYADAICYKNAKEILDLY